MGNDGVVFSSGVDLIKHCGNELYGSMFSLDDPELFEKYKKTYNFLESNSIGKKGKGLLVIGNVGAGKSAMMRVMQMAFKDTKSRFKWVSALHLKDLSEQFTTMEIKKMYGFDLKMDLYIDDIGINNDVKRYGTVVNIISEIIMERYELFVSSGIKTHLSSNLKPSSTVADDKFPTLEKLYGNRVVDRIIEMCSLIKFNGKSLRK